MAQLNIQRYFHHFQLRKRINHWNFFLFYNYCINNSCYCFFTGGKEQKVNENNKKGIDELFNLLKEDDDKDNIFKYLKISENRLDTNIENNHQYIAKAIVGAKIGNYIENTEAVMIEVFDDTDDLKLRVEYLKA